MCVCVCVRVCGCVHVCVVDKEGSKVVASVTRGAVAVVVQTPVYLTGYNDCLTGFHEPLWTLYR